MPGATLATLDAVTKEIYEGSLREQLDNDVKTLRRIEKTSDGVSNEVGGRYVTFPVHTRRNTGIGARAEGAALPAAGYQGTAAARVGLKHLYGAVRLTGQAISLIDTNYQSFISAMDMEIDGLRKDLARDLNRQVYGDGTGAIATLTADATTTNDIVVDRPDLFNLGDYVDICTGTVVDVAGRYVTAIVLSTKTVTLDGAAFSQLEDDIVVRNGSNAQEWTGLAAIIAASGALFNIDPATEPVWVATDKNNSGTPRALSENLMTTMSDDIRTVGGGQPSVIFTTLGVRRAYVNLLTADRQYVNTKSYDGGFSGYGFQTDDGEIPVVTDIMCPSGTMYFVNEKNIKLYRESDWKWMDRDSSKWQRAIDSSGEYDAYGARLYQYSELGTSRRNSHGVLSDIIEA